MLVYSWVKRYSWPDIQYQHDNAKKKHGNNDNNECQGDTNNNNIPYNNTMNMNDNTTHFPSILFIIHSRPESSEKRRRIRETWASLAKSDFRGQMDVVFISGLSQDAHVQEDLAKEIVRHNDLLQEDFIDT